jgi:hypothetical protein
MQTNVYANDLEIASKAADGKATAAFPDICWSPPSPPAGPVQLPYPNTTYARDITNGTSTVYICGQEVAIEDQSFFATSTGNEPATEAFPKGILTHVITGKAYFQSWSFDVVFEGFGVPRHTDLTTHNHGSKPGQTPPNVYMDDPNAKVKCAGDKKDIVKKCQPEKPQSDEDEKKGVKRRRKGGLSGKLAEAAEGLDKLGKNKADYKRNKASRTALDGNAWMEDHCSGLWITPCFGYSEEFENNLTEMLEKLEDDKYSMMMNLLDEIKEMALEKAKDEATEIIGWLAAKTTLKAGVGIATAETLIGPYLMATWTAADILSTAADLAELAGAKGKAAYESMKNLYDISDKGEQILADYKENPHKAHADAMTVMAQIDPCTRARKCMLPPYENTKGLSSKSKAKSQAKHGNGCCPGQTGHHILPDSMVKEAGCPGYDQDKAPVMCLEGRNNCETHGSHGGAHGALKETMSDYKTDSSSDTISYEDAKKQGLDAAQKSGAAHCDRDCLEAQLDAHYKGCKDKQLKATAGTGGGAKSAGDGELTTQ